MSVREVDWRTKEGLIFGRVNLSFGKKKNSKPVIEIIDSNGFVDGDILVLRVLRRGQ